MELVAVTEDSLHGSVLSIWDVSCVTRKHRWDLGMNERFSQVIPGPSGSSCVAVGTEGVFELNCESGSVKRLCSIKTHGVVLIHTARDRCILAMTVVDKDVTHLRIVDVYSPQHSIDVSEPNGMSSVTALAISPDGNLVATGDTSGFVVVRRLAQ